MNNVYDAEHRTAMNGNGLQTVCTMVTMYSNLPPKIGKKRKELGPPKKFSPRDVPFVVIPLRLMYVSTPGLSSILVPGTMPQDAVEQGN